MVTDAEVETSFRLAREAELNLARTEAHNEGVKQGLRRAVTILEKRADALEEMDERFRQSGMNMRRMNHGREIKTLRKHAKWLENLL